MGLAEDLLAQANQLATMDRNRPKQANLRRAISSSYYAIFHLLVSAAVLEFVPRRPVGLTPRVGRAFQHGEMKQACAGLQRRPLTGPLFSLLGATVSAELDALAVYFVELQEARHATDYDTGIVFSRGATLAIVAKAQDAFSIWHQTEGTDEANVFLAALAFGARWSK